MKSIVVLFTALQALAEPICTFRTPTQLARCQSRFYEWTSSVCPSSLQPDPPGIDVGTAQAFPFFGATGVGSQPSQPRVWRRLHDKASFELLTHWVTGAKPFRFRDLGALFRFDQATIALVLALVCPLLSLVACLTLCLKCCRRKRPPLKRRPKRFALITSIIIGLSIYVIYAASIRTRRVNKAETAGRCLVPRSIQEAVSNRVLDVPMDGNEAFSSLTKLVSSLETARSEAHHVNYDYLPKFDAPSLASFSLTAPFAPLLWTGPLLEHHHTQAPDVHGVMATVATHHTLVGYHVLRNMGDFNSRDSGPLSHMYMQLDAAEDQMNFDVRPVRRSVSRLVEHLNRVHEDVNEMLVQASDWVNDSGNRAPLQKKILTHRLTIAPFSYIVPSVLLGLVAIGILAYFISAKRCVDEVGVLIYFGILSLSLILYATLLLLVCGVLLMVFKVVKSGCEYGIRDMMEDAVHERDIETLIINDIAIGSMDLTRFVKTCVRKSGDGDTLALLDIDEELKNLANRTLTYDIDVQFIFKPSFDDKLRDLGQASGPLTWVVPAIEDYEAESYLLQTSAVFLESGIQVETEAIDCSNSANEDICDTVKELRKDLGIYMTGDHIKLYGLSDISRELTAIFAPLKGEGCPVGTVCVYGDTSCKGADLIVDDSTFAIPPQELLSDVPGHFGQLRQTMSRTPQASRALGCLKLLSEVPRTAAVLGIYWSLLKVHLLKSSFRVPNLQTNDQTVNAENFPGYFDTCPPGAACSMFYRFHDNMLQLIPYSHFRSSLATSWTAALEVLGADDLHKTLLDLGVTINPIGRFIGVATVPLEEYNCQVAGRVLDSYESFVCDWWGPAWTRLASSFLMLAVLFVSLSILLFAVIHRHWTSCRNSPRRRPAPPSPSGLHSIENISR